MTNINVTLGAHLVPAFGDPLGSNIRQLRFLRKQGGNVNCCRLVFFVMFDAVCCLGVFKEIPEEMIFH